MIRPPVTVCAVALRPCTWDDQRLINELTQERKKALKLQRSLNVSDDAAVRDVIATYSPAARRSED